MNWRIIYTNQLMELLLMTKSSLGLSQDQLQELKILWNGLTENGKEHFRVWCEDQNINFSKFLKA